MIDWAIFSLLSLSIRTDDEDNNKTDHDQCGGDYGDQENAASTGGEAAADDPVLYNIQLRSESVVTHFGERWVKVEKFRDSNTLEQ